jgi:hypothetical protein
MTTLRLGNAAPHQARKDRETGDYILDETGNKIFDPVVLDAPTETQVALSPDDNLLEQLRAVDDLWRSHSSEPPTWVWSDDPAVETVFAMHFGVDAMPDDVEETHYTHSGPPGNVAPVPVDDVVEEG